MTGDWSEWKIFHKAKYRLSSGPAHFAGIRWGSTRSQWTLSQVSNLLLTSHSHSPPNPTSHNRKGVPVRTVQCMQSRCMVDNRDVVDYDDNFNEQKYSDNVIRKLLGENWWAGPGQWSSSAWLDTAKLTWQSRLSENFQSCDTADSSLEVQGAGRLSVAPLVIMAPSVA